MHGFIAFVIAVFYLLLAVLSLIAIYDLLRIMTGIINHGW